MRIYLDNCCFNRLYDDWRSDRVRLEAEAVQAILSGCESGRGDLCGSDVLRDEIMNTPNVVRRQKVLLLYLAATCHIELTDAIAARAVEIGCSGIKAYDALHLASAEAARADVFLTTDRRLVRAAGRAGLRIRVCNPLIWLMERLYGASAFE